MKTIKWHSLIITCLVCLLPILLGLLFWNELPRNIAIHFNMNNQPDNFTSKEFAVFGLPILMVLFQIFCCVVMDLNAKKHGEQKKPERVAKWIIPVTTVLLQIATLGFALGFEIDIRKVASFLVGGMLLVMGNYLPKLDYVKNKKLTPEKARKINRFFGFESVIMGLLFLISIFLPPIATVICVILLVPYSVIGTLYGIKIENKKE